MALRKFNGITFGRVPWALTQDQRGPTCGMTAISVAYRILTGWTIFPTKGHFRTFNENIYGIVLNKGQENAYVLRRAAKDLSHTVAGEIVNADSLANLVNLCEDVEGQVVELDDSATFVTSVEYDIKNGCVPIVLFHVELPLVEGTGLYRPQRGGRYRHWVAIVGVKKEGTWHCVKSGHFPLTSRVMVRKQTCSSGIGGNRSSWVAPSWAKLRPSVSTGREINHACLRSSLTDPVSSRGSSTPLMTKITTRR